MPEVANERSELVIVNARLHSSKAAAFDTCHMMKRAGVPPLPRAQARPFPPRHNLKFACSPQDFGTPKSRT
jgi:hypothetical protein